MIVGKYIGKIESKSNFLKIVCGLLGHLDLHTQIRTKPIIKYIKKNKRSFENKNIIEIGCSKGNNCFEIYFASVKAKILGFDFNCEEIKRANEILNKFGIVKNIQFFCADATKYDYSTIGKVDYVLLIDFIEHINEPEKFIESLKTILNEESEIIVSVPTYLYKKVFGNNFHLRVGHVKDGYNLEELNK